MLIIKASKISVIIKWHKDWKIRKKKGKFPTQIHIPRDNFLAIVYVEHTLLYIYMLSQ